MVNVLALSAVGFLEVVWARIKILPEVLEWRTHRSKTRVCLSRMHVRKEEIIRRQDYCSDHSSGYGANKKGVQRTTVHTSTQINHPSFFISDIIRVPPKNIFVRLMANL